MSAFVLDALRSPDRVACVPMTWALEISNVVARKAGVKRFGPR